MSEELFYFLCGGYMVLVIIFYGMLKYWRKTDIEELVYCRPLYTWKDEVSIIICSLTVVIPTILICLNLFDGIFSSVGAVYSFGFCFRMPQELRAKK